MNSSRRRKARELMVQAIYAHDVGGVDMHESVVNQIERRGPHVESLAYVKDLEGLLKDRLQELDGIINSALVGRDPSRVGAVERAILRIALVELMDRPDIPDKVAINEAVEMALTFSSEDSARFVNGILDQLSRGIA